MQRLLNHHSKFSVKFTAKLFWVIFIMEMESVMHTKKPDDLQLFANHPVFQFETEFFQSLVKNLFDICVLVIPLGSGRIVNDAFDALFLHICRSLLVNWRHPLIGIENFGC